MILRNEERDCIQALVVNGVVGRVPGGQEDHGERVLNVSFGGQGASGQP